MATVGPTGRYYIDSADMWLNFGIGVESGSDDFLKLPKTKDRTTHNWSDENGLDMDVTRTFFEAKEIELKVHLIADNDADFWSKYNKFLTVLAKPGTRRLTVTELNRDFFIVYKECTFFTRYTRLLEANKVATKFTIKLLELVPNLDEQVFIVDEENKFLIA